MEMTYGMDIKSHEDKFLQAAERLVELVGETLEPGAFLVDTFPIRSSPNSESSWHPTDNPASSEAHPRLVPWGRVQTIRQDRSRTVHCHRRRPTRLREGVFEGLSMAYT